jgi:hypothetical protein
MVAYPFFNSSISAFNSCIALIKIG